MKKLAALIFMAFVLVSAQAENIDGTLAVDNTSNTAQLNSDDVLHAGIDDGSTKDAEVATSTPVNTYPDPSLEGPFIGLELGGVLASEADGLSSGGISFGIRFGAQNVDWRTMAIIDHFSDDNSINSYTRGIVQLDYFFMGMQQLKLDTYGIRPYAGVNAGLISLDTTTENIKSLTYGAQLGATMAITNNIDLDVGIRYNLSSSDTIDHTSNIVAGIHYKY